MDDKFSVAFQNNPVLGYVASFSSLGLGVVTSTYDSFIQNVDLLTKMVALSAALLGAFAGAFTLLIQRRNYKLLMQGIKTPPFTPDL